LACVNKRSRMREEVVMSIAQAWALEDADFEGRMEKT